MRIWRAELGTTAIIEADVIEDHDAYGGGKHESVITQANIDGLATAKSKVFEEKGACDRWSSHHSRRNNGSG